ncbi:MAG: hypothetical protein LBB22_04150 [Treponema sp.]|nr:hypothetical protein [Treponema sp.]
MTFSQTKGTVFAPFVSRLTAEVTGRQVRLSWIDSDSVKGPVYIYRSVQPYQNNAGEKMNQAAEVAYGMRSYTDIVPTEGKWYYFVVASDLSRQKYDLTIPFNNTIDVSVGGNNKVPVTGSDINPDEYAPVFYNFGTQVKPEPSQNPYGGGKSSSSWPSYSFADGIIHPPARANITGITATARGKGIEITFSTSEASKNAVLYRSIQPLRNFSDLLTATVAALNVKSPYTDNVTPGVPYYYAIVYEDDIRNGRGEIFPGSNATFIPAEVSLNQKSAPDTYSGIPNSGYTAPYQQTQPVAGDVSRRYEDGGSSVNDGAYQQRSVVPSAIDTYQTYRTYQNQSDESLILREPRVFNSDMRISGDPADQKLSAIVQGPFMWRNWAAARTELANYLYENADNSAASTRARFYLAQCSYFTGDIRTALTEFLKLQQIYPDETSIWIQSCLNRLAER